MNTTRLASRSEAARKAARPAPTRPDRRRRRWSTRTAALGCRKPARPRAAPRRAAAAAPDRSGRAACSSAVFNWPSRASACGRSSVQSGEPQWVHALPAARCTGRAAVGAVHRAQALRQLGDLLGAERLDEVLLAQEVEEGRQPAVAVGAAQVRERGVALAVVRQAQPAVAARALGHVAVGEGRRARGPGADRREQRQRRSRRQARALVRVEPEGLAAVAHVDDHRRARAALQRRIPPSRPDSAGSSSRVIVPECRRWPDSSSESLVVSR